MSDFEAWVAKVSEWKDATSSIPALVREDIVKSKYEPEDAKRGLRAIINDPLSVQYALGYKDRKYSLTYDVLKRIPQQLSVIAAILQTRCNQVASFAAPFRLNKSLGFVVKHKDPGRLTTKGEREFIQNAEQFIYNCGADEPNPHNRIKRDDFETFLRKIVRDSLMYDQAVGEIVPDKRGQPYEFMAVDAATIRLAAPNSILGQDVSYVQRTPLAGMQLSGAPYRHMRLYDNSANKPLDQQAAYVQVVNGQIENIFTREEMFFGVRNPRSDIYIQGYGYGELEQLITIITAHLNAEMYNSNFFTNASMPKGMLNLKGDSMSPDQLEGFKRQWRATMEGVGNSFRTPILQSEQGIDWIDMHPTNQEMEFGSWLEYTLKIISAVFLIDPAEINFDLKGGVQQTPLFESSQEWKLKASRDRGLKPLLRFLARLVNENIMSKMDDHFTFDFVGLDELTEQEKHELRKEQVASYMTLNEIRRAEDMPDVEDGDVILNPTYLQAKQIKMQIQQSEMKQQQQQQAASAQGAQPQGQGGPPQGSGQQDSAPQYADTYTKSLNATSGDKYLEIDLDSLDSWKDSVKG